MNYGRREKNPIIISILYYIIFYYFLRVSAVTIWNSTTTYKQGPTGGIVVPRSHRVKSAGGVRKYRAAVRAHTNTGTGILRLRTASGVAGTTSTINTTPQWVGIETGASFDPTLDSSSINNGSSAADEEIIAIEFKNDAVSQNCFVTQIMSWEEDA